MTRRNRAGLMMAPGLMLCMCAGLLSLSYGAEATGPHEPASPSSAFTYQGRLSSQSSGPIDGTCDLWFSLYDSPDGPQQIGSALERSSVELRDGYFTVDDLDFGAGAFDGAARYLEIAADCPAGTGDPQTFQRQAITAVPYALHSAEAASVPWSGLVGVPQDIADGDDDTLYGAGVGLDLTAGSFSISPAYRLPQGCPGGAIAEWDGVAWQCGTDDVGSGGAAVWTLTGNLGTTAGTNFLGTADDEPLELHVNGSRALRLEPDVTAPNVLGGYEGNGLESGLSGATIGGGGRDLATNQVSDDFGTIGGGAGNLASGYAATIGGGEGNEAGNNYSTVAGGAENTATGLYGVVAGGRLNEATASYGSIAGGYGNVISDTFATIGGGQDNVITSTHATVAGGGNNEVRGAYASVGGGSYNNVTGAYGTISGGGPADPGNPTTSNNRVLDDYGVVGGGGYNVAGFADEATTNQQYATVAGGQENSAADQYTFVGGGYLNRATGYAASIGGGYDNEAGDNYATVAGGTGNTVTGTYGVVAGGSANEVTASYGTIPGGAHNYVGGPYGFAAGSQARAEHLGSFVWSDSTGGLASTAPDQFLIGASGGVGIGTDSPVQALTVQGSGLFLVGDEPAARGQYTTSWGLLDAPSAVYATGSEAYVTSSATNTLAILNVSDPSKIEYIGYTTSNLSGPSDVFVSGQRAYVTSGENHRLVVFDVSNPSAPDSLGFTDEGLANPVALYVAGKYAYVASNGPGTMEGLAIFDVSDPTHIRLCDSTSTNLQGPSDVFVAGSHAYVTDAANNSLAVFDISDPRPGQIKAVGTATGPFNSPQAVIVSGPYAYVVADGSDNLVIFDVSDPNNIVTAGSTGANLADPLDVFVAGDVAYVASSGNDRLAIFDVSDPVNIVALGFAETGAKPVSLLMTGKQIYVANETGNSVGIYEVTHLEAPAVQTGNLQTAYLDVIDNAAINNDLAVHGGLQVGTGGALIGGALSVTGKDDSHILGALSVGGVGALISDTVDLAKTEWITAPTHALDVIGEGRFRVNDYHNLVLRSPNAGSDEDAYIDLIRSNQTTVMTSTARIEFDAADPFTHTTSIHFHTQGPDDSTMISRLQISAQGHLLPDRAGYYTLGDDTFPWLSVHTLGGVLTTSDGRYKENVRALPYGLDEVNALRPVTFNWTDGPDAGVHYGLIAQEVREILPDIVSGDDNQGEMLGMNYGELVPVLVRAMQEQQQEIDGQAAEIAALEARLAVLEEGVASSNVRPGSLNVLTTLGFGGLALGLVVLAGKRRKGGRG